MTKSIISEFLKRPIAYQPIVAKSFGSVKLAILWCQFYYWNDKTKNKEGWIYKTREDIFNETGLSRKEQETARRIGKELGVLESKRMGSPCTVNFRIDLDKACQIIQNYISRNGEKELKQAPAELPTETAEITPGEYAARFFEGGINWLTKKENITNEFLEVAKIVAGQIGKEQTKEEMKKFILYWTEPTKSGKKQNWELRKTFDVKRRFYTWLNNKKERSAGQNQKRGTII